MNQIININDTFNALSSKSCLSNRGPKPYIESSILFRILINGRLETAHSQDFEFQNPHFQKCMKCTPLSDPLPSPVEREKFVNDPYSCMTTQIMLL